MAKTIYEAIRQAGGEVVALVEEINALSPAARKAARKALWDAEWDPECGPTWDAAQHAVRDAQAAMWDVTWDDTWEAVLATAFRNVISPEHYATLMAPMEAARAVMLRERPQ